MPKKTIVTTITLGEHDPAHDTVEARDGSGNLLLPASRGVVQRNPGEPVTLDAAEADRILARWGGEVIEEIPDEEPADAQSAGKAGKAPAK